MARINKNYPPIPSNLDEKIRDATGFFLEHKVAIVLEKNEWQVIHNRYYLEDSNATQREMDIIAYKVTEVNDINVYTTLVISCKKTIDNNWVFLTRKSKGTRNNISSFPLTNFCNDDALKYQMRKNKWDSKLTENTDRNWDFFRQFSSNEDIIFAFREYNNSKSTIANDTAIYESINTLLKSQDYELNSLRKGRRENPCYYHFNLLAVNEVVSMIKVDCHEEQMESSVISQIHYVNRFIVNKEVNHALIDFISFDALESQIIKYNSLHSKNCKIIESEVNQFYQVSIFSDYSAKQLIYDKAKESLISDLHFFFSIDLKGFEHYSYKLIEPLSLESNNTNKTFYFTIPVENQQLLNVLNNNEEIKTIVSTWFDTYFHYKGSFSFEHDGLPF